MSLTARILLLVVLALIPALGIQLYNETELRAAREQVARAVALRGARAVSSDLAQFSDGARQVLDILVEQPAIHERDASACTEILRSVAPKLSGVRVIVVTDVQGQLVCNSRGAPPGAYSLADRHYFQKVMATGAPSIGEYVIGRGTGLPTIQFAYPLKDAAGALTGLLNLGYDPEWLSRRLGEAGLPREATLTVTDSAGTILARLPDHAAWVGKPIPPEFQAALAQAIEAGGVADMPGLRGAQRITGVVHPKGALDGLTVSVGLDRSLAFSDIDAATRRGLFLILIGALVALAAGWVGSRVFIQRPVRSLLSAAHVWREGGLGARSGLTGSSEFGRLGEAFDTMAAALQRQEDDLRIELSRSRTLQDQQVTMLHELNHRVKNTLATVQSLARQSRAGEGHAGELENRILSLAKTHDLLTRHDWTRASLRTVLENELAPYRDEGVSRFTLNGAEVDLPPRYVLALGMTAHELTTNAAKYGALSTEDGRVHVDWRIGRGADGGERLLIEWYERRGPRVSMPTRRGFGSRLITGGIARELDGEVRLDFHPDGLCCTIDVPLQDAVVMTAH